MRALAVLAVMAFHEGLRAVPGGFLGVDVFFVLSGYLITDLLVTRHERSGRMDLRLFWARRARRLLPALAVMLVAVTAAASVIEPDQLPTLRPALAAAVTYSSNWYEALGHVSYFAAFGPPPPLEHLWSLAIEEQFYLAWPLILALVLTRVRGHMRRVGAAWLGAAASAVTMAVVYVPGADPSRVYYGTDTHATALLVGAALALTWPLATLTDAPRELVRRLDIAGIAGLAVLAWAAGHFSGADPALYPAGLVIAALAAAGLTAAATAPGAVSAMLSVGPLRWLGVRSYGIYLWHWPVIALTEAWTGPGHASPWLPAPEAGVAIALAAASWKWVETPILGNGFRAACRAFCTMQARSIATVRRSPTRALPALATVAMIGVACAAGYGMFRPPAASGLEQQVALGEKVSAASRERTAPTPHSTAPDPTPSPTPTGAVPPNAATPEAPRGSGTSVPGRVQGRQITAIGDSVMLASARQLAAALPGIYIDARISRQMQAGLAAVRRLAGSGRLRQVVVVGLGTNGTVTAGQLRQLVHIIGPHRGLVLINTYEARPWEHEVNGALAAAARSYRNVVLADWLRTIEHHTNLLWGDQVHPRPSGAALYARMVARAVQAIRIAATSRRVAGVPGKLPRMVIRRILTSTLQPASLAA